MKKFFVTATGTDIGKTYITAALTERLRRQGGKVTALKPVISGFDPANAEESDTGILLKAQGLLISEENIHYVSPWRFTDPISPDMAADNEKRPIDFPALITFCRNNEKTDYLLVEGVGGVMTPIGKNHTVLDWMAELDYPVILAAGSYLGTLSHTLTAYQSMLARNLKLHMILISESETSPVPVEHTVLTLKRFLPNDLPIHSINRHRSLETLPDGVL